MEFNKKIQLFIVTVLSLVVYVRAAIYVLGAFEGCCGDRACNEGVYYYTNKESAVNIVCDRITCPLETDRCYVLKIYGEGNSLRAYENICYAKNNTILEKNTDAQNLGYGGIITEITLRSDGSSEYFDYNLGGEMSHKTLRDIENDVVNKKTLVRASIDKLKIKMDRFTTEIQMKGMEMANIGQTVRPVSVMLEKMEQARQEMDIIRENMNKVSYQMSEATKGINWVNTSIANTCSSNNLYYSFYYN